MSGNVHVEIRVDANPAFRALNRALLAMIAIETDQWKRTRRFAG